MRAQSLKQISVFTVCTSVWLYSHLLWKPHFTGGGQIKKMTPQLQPLKWPWSLIKIFDTISRRVWLFVFCPSPCICQQRTACKLCLIPVDGAVRSEKQNEKQNTSQPNEIFAYLISLIWWKRTVMMIFNIVGDEKTTK